MKHYLKILPVYFGAIKSRDKSFELRFDDRGFSVGDFLILRECVNGRYTGRFLYRRITYILCDVPFGLSSGYCILSLI